MLYWPPGNFWELWQNKHWQKKEETSTSLVHNYMTWQHNKSLLLAQEYLVHDNKSKLNKALVLLKQWVRLISKPFVNSANTNKTHLSLAANTHDYKHADSGFSATSLLGLWHDNKTLWWHHHCGDKIIVVTQSLQWQHCCRDTIAAVTPLWWHHRCSDTIAALTSSVHGCSDTITAMTPSLRWHHRFSDTITAVTSLLWWHHFCHDSTSMVTPLMSWFHRYGDTITVMIPSLQWHYLNPENSSV